MSFGLKLKAAVKSFGYWGTIRNFYQTKSLADELIGHYDEYPTSPAAMANWTRQRDSIMDRVYETTGADAKY
jgi:hypothetical protein